MKQKKPIKKFPFSVANQLENLGICIYDLLVAEKGNNHEMKIFKNI